MRTLSEFRHSKELSRATLDSKLQGISKVERRPQTSTLKKSSSKLRKLSKRGFTRTVTPSSVRSAVKILTKTKLLLQSIQRATHHLNKLSSIVKQYQDYSRRVSTVEIRDRRLVQASRDFRVWFRILVIWNLTSLQYPLEQEAVIQHFKVLREETLTPLH